MEYYNKARDHYRAAVQLFADAMRREQTSREAENLIRAAHAQAQMSQAAAALAQIEARGGKV